MITIRLTDIIIAIMALYGAVIATITLVRQIKQGKIKVKVKTTKGIPVQSNGVVGEMHYCFTASNHGLRKITLANFGIYMPKIKMYFFYPFPCVNSPYPIPRFPYELKPGSSCSYYVPIDDLKSHLQKYAGSIIKLEPCYMDALDNRHTAKRINFKIS
jgi:hypothetical protein